MFLTYTKLRKNIETNIYNQCVYIFMFDENSLTRLRKFFPEDKFVLNNFDDALYIKTNPSAQEKTKLCAFIEERNNTHLHLGGLLKCGENSGTAVLEKIVAFAKNNGYSKISLVNVADIRAPCKKDKWFSASLTFVKLLEIGNTWYSQFGFESETSKELEGKIKEIINNTFANLLEKLNDVNENNETKNKENRDSMETYRNKLGFTDETVISEFIIDSMKKIREQVDSICGNIDELGKFIKFLGDSLSTIVTDRKTTIVEALIEKNFKHLTLDLKKSGGKKAKTIKRRKMKAKAIKKKSKKYRKRN